MKQTDCEIDDLLGLHPEGLQRETIATMTGIDQKEVGKALDRLRRYGLAYNNDAEHLNRRCQRLWFSKYQGDMQVTRIVVPATSCQPIGRKVPFSVFNLCRAGA